MEIIETVYWGLNKLGHSTTYSLNDYEPNAINIVFGAQIMTEEYVLRLPSNTIIYNLEQMRGLDIDRIRSSIKLCAQRFRIWEYSEANLDAWEMIGAKNVKLVPIGYAPILTRIPKRDEQEIDVLIYGMAGEKRLDIFSRLSKEGIRVVFVSGLYGDVRDALIASSKLVLNVNLMDFAQIFEVVRVSYLLANRKAVVATMDARTAIEPDLMGGIHVSTPEAIVADCIRLLDDDNQRARLENVGFDIFAKRDIKEILRFALGSD